MKSPIETRLRDALRNTPAGTRLTDYTDCRMSQSFNVDTLSPEWTGTGWAQRVLEFYVDGVDNYVEVDLHADVPILSYRADLYLHVDGFGLVIECDGHDHHNLTKQQAAYDRSRDRDLLKLDISTARFTGSEIHHSAERCASEVWAVVQMFSRRIARRQQDFSNGWKAGKDRAVWPITRADI